MFNHEMDELYQQTKTENEFTSLISSRQQHSGSSSQRSSSSSTYGAISELDKVEQINNRWYHADDIQQLSVVIWQALPRQLKALIYVTQPYTLEMLQNSLLQPGAVHQLKREHTDYIRAHERCELSSQLSLLLIPMMVSSGVLGAVANHFALLVIDLDNKQYYYQDSLGLESNYGKAYQNIHEIMRVFFQQQATLSEHFSQPIEMPVQLREYYRDFNQRYDNSCCVNYRCLKQQQNESDCGPAVVDNIYATVKAYAQGWSIAMLPFIFGTRYKVMLLDDFGLYYYDTRKVFTAWLAASALDPQYHITVEQNQEKIQQQKRVARLIQNKHADYIRYWHEIIKQLFIVIGFADAAVEPCRILQLQPLNHNLCEQADILHKTFIGYVLNFVQNNDYTLVQIVGHYIPRLYQEYLAALRELIIRPTSARAKIKFSHRYMDVVWQSFAIEENCVREQAQKTFLQARTAKKQKNAVSREIIQRYLMASTRLKACLTLLFPKELLDITGKNDCNIDINKAIFDFFRSLDKQYQAVLQQHASQRMPALELLEKKHAEVLKKLCDTSLVNPVNLMYEYDFLRKKFIALLRDVLHGNQASCVIS